jgi:hypothetical protein
MSKMVMTGYTELRRGLNGNEEAYLIDVIGRFKCARCESNSEIRETVRVSKMAMRFTSLDAAITNKLERLAPVCDCDMMRCRIGAAYMRRHRLILKAVKR